MKEIKFLLLILTINIFISQSLVAQESGPHMAGDYAAVNELPGQNAGAENKIAPALVNVRAARDFVKRFKDVPASWHMSNDTSLAKFTSGSITTIAGYAKNGRWLYTVRNFGEKTLPANLRDAVRSQYYDYHINIIYELQFPVTHDKVYIIYLGNEQREHKMIRIFRDDIDVVKHFRS